MVALEDVLAGLGATFTSDPRGGAVTVQRGSHELVCTTRRAWPRWTGTSSCCLAPCVRGGRWLVPVDGLPRLLAPLLERPVEWRAGPRVLVVGPVSIPKISVSTFVSGELARVVFEASESAPFRVQQEPSRVTEAVPRDLVDVAMQPARLAGGIVESVQFLGGAENVFAVQLGPRFQKLKATEQESPARLVLELSGPPLAAGERPALPARRPGPRARRRRPPYGRW